MNESVKIYGRDSSQIWEPAQRLWCCNMYGGHYKCCWESGGMNSRWIQRGNGVLDYLDNCEQWSDCEQWHNMTHGLKA